MAVAVIMAMTAGKVMLKMKLNSDSKVVITNFQLKKNKQTNIEDKEKTTWTAALSTINNTINTTQQKPYFALKSVSTTNL